MVLLGIDISEIKDLQGRTSECCGTMSGGYGFYSWNSNDRYNNMEDWIEQAARQVRK